MIKIAVTSVGSLVAQNILDALDGRREGIEVIGINSAPDAANNFRCDRTYLAPQAANRDDYLAKVASVLGRERPQLVLPGRDDDVLLLARLKEMQPELGGALPVGPHRLAAILDDKWSSRQFACTHGLPYVESVAVDDRQGIERLLLDHGYPLIAKPRRGNGSRGVRIVFDDAQREAVARDRDYLLQPYLAPEADLMRWRDLCRDGTPLFHAPTLTQIACQAIIGADGRLQGPICTMAELVMGRLERTYSIDDSGVALVARGYAEAFAAEGWVGALNLQGRRDRNGSFSVYELNGRLTGGTAARLHLGFDEVGILVESFVGHGLPVRPTRKREAIVTKSLTEFVCEPRDIDRLARDGVWQRTATRP
jgi:hypothetical protein